MLHICCIRAGEAFSPDYVLFLRDMVARNLEGGFEARFVCFTDRPEELPDHIETAPLPANLPGWWSKLALFREGLFPRGDRVLFLDLDTVFTGAIDAIAAYAGSIEDRLAILRDFYRPDGLQSSIMAWRAGEHQEIWDSFELAGCPMNDPGGDQAWIEYAAPRENVTLWQDLFPGIFVSFKQTRGIPSDASVVVFHGLPRPHEVIDGWVPKVWCIGGLSHAELKAVCNTEQEVIFANVRSACARDLVWFDAENPENDRHVAIIGGGPSVTDLLDEIKWRQSIGQDVWVLNKAWAALGNEISIDVQVLLDARMDTATFVTFAGEHLIASQCDPAVFEFAEHAGKTTLWHVNMPGMADLLKDEKARVTYLIGGGNTVGMNALALAVARGYRQIHLYGFDSSFRGDVHHAYPQALNDTDARSDVLYGDKHYVCAPWMVGQANEFMKMAPQYEARGCVITVHGSGLLPDIAAEMMSFDGSDTKIVNGMMWPKHDLECARIAFDISALDLVYPYCSSFGICVQAGGNCGVWPLALAEKFRTVYTFEPDALNFECLRHNAPADNIIKCNAALGNDHDFVGLDRSKPHNCGAFQIVKDGPIPTCRIDDLKLDECGLIYLDIEGFELEALRGAAETIERHHPVIAFEDKGLSERYGVAKGHIEKWMADSFKYRVVERVGRDVIMISTHKENALCH